MVVVCGPCSFKWCVSTSLWAVMLLESTCVCLRTLCINEISKGITCENTGSFMQVVLQRVVGEEKYVCKLRLYNVENVSQLKKARLLSQNYLLKRTSSHMVINTVVSQITWCRSRYEFPLI